MIARAASMFTCALLWCALFSCGGAPAPTARPARPHSTDPIDLSLETTDGRVLELADQRGAPVLLFLFATYDTNSIASMRSAARVARHEEDTIVIGIALQPDARTFARALVDSEAPPYTVTFDPRDVISSGESDLGTIEAIPTFVMIDASGRIVDRRVGYVSERVLGELIDAARARGGIAPAPPE